MLDEHAVIEIKTAHHAAEDTLEFKTSVSDAILAEISVNGTQGGCWHLKIWGILLSWANKAFRCLVFGWK